MNNLQNNPESIWKKTTQNLESNFPPETFKLWFSPLKAVSFSNNAIVVEVPNQYFLERMKKYTDDINSALNTVMNAKNMGIQFTVNPSKYDYLPPKKEDIPEPTYRPESETAFPEIDFNPRYTFDSFIIGSSNRFAQAASEAVANEPGTRYNPLFIYGGVGLGKTHLLHSIGHRIKSTNPQKKVLYVTCEKFTQEWIESIKTNDHTAFNKKYSNISVLLIDDIQFLENKEGTQERFFHIFNNLYESHKQVVISSDKSPDKIKTLEERLRSRFQWGVITDIQPPDLETRIAILKTKSDRENLDAPDDVLLFLATNIKDNIRKLEGSLIRIYAHSSLIGSDVTVDNARKILKDVISNDTLSIPSLEKIKETVARHYRIQMKDLTSKKRTRNFVFPRHFAMYLSRKLTENSTTEIGKEFGGKDHTTVMYACKIIKKKVEEDPYFNTLADKIINKIKAVC